MNKDVIFIEPEDDITDIVAKIESSKEHIIALMPPKQPDVLKNDTNIKLIAKSSREASKTTVLVTDDSAIIHFAAIAKIPVTKNLQTPPTIPQLETPTPDEEDPEDTPVEESPEETPAAEDSLEVSESSSKSQKAKKSKDKSQPLPKNPFLAWIKKHVKIISISAACLLVAIIVGVWMFAIAPAASITIGIRITSNNFSENISFTENLAEEDSETGKFYLSQKSLKNDITQSFKATGKKNVGEKATGTVIAYYYFKNRESIAIPAGSIFSNNDLQYSVAEDAALSFNGEHSSCDNSLDISDFFSSGCLITTEIQVIAAEPGAKYNLAAGSTDWSSATKATIYSETAFSGGTDKIVTVVQQSDIDKALESIKNPDSSEAKASLLASLGEDAFGIDNSYTQTVSDPVSTPALGEEVKEGQRAELKISVSSNIYTIDRTKVEEFIAAKAKLSEGYKIYSIINPFIENFTKSDSGYIGKLKTPYTSGTKVTENEIVETIRGKSFGIAKHDLGDIEGIGQIDISPSYPWVTAFPDNPEKITVSIEVLEK